MTATDTLHTAATMREPGMNERQSAAAAHAVEDAVARATAELVTRDYLRAELAHMEKRLIVWAIGVAVTVGAAAVGTLLAALFRPAPVA